MTLTPGRTVVVSIAGVAEPSASTVTVTVDATSLSSTTPQPSAPTATRASNTPAILGSTLGGLLLLSLIAIAILLILYRRRRTPPESEEREAFSIESIRHHEQPEERVEPFLDRRVSFLTTRARGSGEWERGVPLSTISSSTGGVPEEEVAVPAPPAPPQRMLYPPPAHGGLKARRADGLPIYAAYSAPPLAVRNPTEAVADALARRPEEDAPPASPLQAPRPPGMERTASASSMATSLATTLV